MRGLIALLLVVPTWAHAEVSVGASVGAGAQGDATYGALELRLDAAWPSVRLGLGARGIWDNAEFRRADWASPFDAITIVRDFEATHEVGDTTLGVAAGALAPARVGRVVDGYRVALDDRWRTGVRAAARAEEFDVGIELDDMLDPALVAAGVRWQMARPWGMQIAIAADPYAPATEMEAGGPAPTAGTDGTHAVTAIEAGAHRRIEAEQARLDLGVSVVGEISLGASVVAFGDAALDRAGIRWTARGDVRAGTGTVGSLFGPLYRIERLAHAGQASLWDRARADELSGASAGLSIGAAAPAGWIEVGARARPGLGGLVTAGGGAPMGKWVQAGIWAAAGRNDAAGAAELRIAWANRLFSALQGARMYRLDPMDPTAVWSLTAWFGAATR